MSFVCTGIYIKTKIMTLTERIQKLKSVFSYEHIASIEGSPLEIRPYRFEPEIGNREIKRFRKKVPTTDFCPVSDNNIEENKHFTYTVFVPRGTKQTGRAIVLLHGLNERSWEKYLPWAEQLCLQTGAAVILFPIAFHMNRTPKDWSNPRTISPFVDLRKQALEEPVNTTFVNLAISSRISQCPLRFYISGRESIYNVRQLIKEIKNGRHPLFKEGSSVHIFAYSIGAFLAQVLFLSDPDKLFSDSRLFMFCGGTIFSRMDGSARDIMDRESFLKMRDYYLNDFVTGNKGYNDSMTKAFKSMLTFPAFREYRESFFQEIQNRIKAITLKKDMVIPTIGVREALGFGCSGRALEEWDYPYEYSHQVPFPILGKVPAELVTTNFNTLFNQAANHFL
jgi:pimeloyl-ACP methyl ester carboxylesterase